MKNKGKTRIMIALFAVVLCMAAFPLTAYAGGGEESEAEPPAETTEPVTEPNPATVNPVALTPDGNLTLVDDIDEQEGESLKQFITVVTKDGNYFYIIIDRVGDKENVYFLNMVDEADLLALIEDMDTAPAQPVPVTPEPEPDPEPEPTEPVAEEKGGGMGGILLIVIVLAAGGGAFYYFKILKPKQAVKGSTDLSELDELDFDSDDDYSDMGAAEPEQEGDEE